MYIKTRTQTHKQMHSYLHIADILLSTMEKIPQKIFCKQTNIITTSQSSISFQNCFIYIK